jgi:hypothetical protein
MSLHIGGKREIAEKKILMILDFDQAVSNPDTGSFLETSKLKYKISDDSKQKKEQQKVRETKSIVVVEKDGEIDFFYSPISSVTLAGRCKNEWTE